MNKRRSLLIIAMCVVMMFTTVAAFAAGGQVRMVGPEDSRSVGSGTVSFSRVAALEGKATLTANSFQTNVDYIKATVTVERKYSSGWDQYYAPYEVYGNAKTGVLSLTEYVDVNASGTYRVKVVYEDKVGSVISKTNAFYSSAVSL